MRALSTLINTLTKVKVYTVHSLNAVTYKTHWPNASITLTMFFLTQPAKDLHHPCFTNEILLKLR